jgi:hypothetical protein
MVGQILPTHPEPLKLGGACPRHRTRAARYCHVTTLEQVVNSQMLDQSPLCPASAVGRA